MNFKKVFMSMLNFIVLVTGLILYTSTCKADINGDLSYQAQIVRHLRDTLLIGADQDSSIFTIAYITDHSNDINFNTNWPLFWQRWDQNAGSFNAPYPIWNTSAGIQSTLQAEIKYINEVGGISDYLGSWMGKEAIRAVGQAAYYATTTDHLLKIQPILTDLKNAKRTPGSTPLFFTSTACNAMNVLNDIQTALNTKDQNFLNAQATVFNTNLASATTYAAVKSIINNALAYTPAFPTITSFTSFGTTLLNAFNKAVTLVQPADYQELASLITATTTQPKYGQDFAVPRATINAKMGIGSSIDSLKAATMNKNLDQMITLLINVVGASTTDATLKTNLNTAVIAALKIATGLVTNSTQGTQLSSIITTAKKNSAINTADLAKIATEVGYVTQFYTSSISFNDLNSMLTAALKITTPVTTNFATHVYKALTTLITLIPSGVVRSPVTMRADLTANKTAATTRANAIKDAKKTFDTARLAKFMASFKIQINALSTQLPKN
jgi:hypothetical protein